MARVFEEYISKEIPNTYNRFINKTKIINRQVLFEKIETLELSESDKFENYLRGYVKFTGLNFFPSAVIIEKDMSVLLRSKTKANILRHKKQKYEAILNYVSRIKSDVNDKIVDVTSLENVNFNEQCTNEQIKELKDNFDYYVFQYSFDEINCEIKNKDVDGVDCNRLNYCKNDIISSDIRKFFTENKTIRLPVDYDELVLEKTNELLCLNVKKRKILFEKINNRSRIDFYGYIFKE